MSGTEPAHEQLDPRIEVRQIDRVHRHDRQGWEIRYEGEPIGRIYRQRIGRARVDFYKAIGYFPATGEEVCLELSPYFSERCDTLVAFHLDPQSSVH